MDLSISAIQNGIVIDHIPSEKTFTIFNMFNDEKLKNTVSIGFNLKSQLQELKGIIKIENYSITPKEIEQITFITPSATINIIENFKVIKKSKLTIPDKIEDVLICPNAKCITRVEKNIQSIFYIQDKKTLPLKATCHYCEKNFTQDDILEILKQKEKNYVV